ncbi:molybdate ABC transporter substrate-binding protein [Pararhodobacter sp.]|uniref:molybdate ABC transporter substrate-binding protein n=1 Tax=Pararhodobacter sp. TaxID=2127056 RepID=UPI002AFF1B46|nr:molybdate ABC transporter substrate-binding protein [Pararhodobacter sp.]
MSSTRLALAFSAALLVPTQAPAAEVLVFAAASLRTALDDIAEQWQAETGHSVLVSYAGSSAQARQIIAGAPADIFLSASTDWMDAVQAEGLIADGMRRDLLGNALVLIAHAAAAPVTLTPALDLAAMLGDGHLAMALVDAVPAGQYGKAALQSLGLWEAVAPLVVQTDNVRAALALVALGEAPLGIVYATDARAEPAVTVLGTFPDESHPAITYPLALLTEARDPADRAFYDALQGEAARAVFERHGFVVLDQP